MTLRIDPAPKPKTPPARLIVSDGTTVVSDVRELIITSGGTLTNGGGGVANLAITGGGGGGGITSLIGAGNLNLNTATVKVPNAVGLDIPLASALTLMNANSATLVDNTNGPLVWTAGSTASGNVSGARWPAPAAPWTFTVQADVISQDGSGNDQIHVCGVTDGTKLQSIVLTSDQLLRVMAWNSTTSFNTTQISKTLSKYGQPLWFRVGWTGTVLTYDWSPNGFSWINILTQSGGGLFLTPTDFFLGANITGNDAVTPSLISFNRLKQT